MEADNAEAEMNEDDSQGPEHAPLQPGHLLRSTDTEVWIRGNRLLKTSAHIEDCKTIVDNLKGKPDAFQGNLSSDSFVFLYLFSLHIFFFMSPSEEFL